MKFETTRYLNRLIKPEDIDFYCRLYTCPKVMKLIGPPLSNDEATSAFYRVLQLSQLHTPHFQYLAWIIEDKARHFPIGLQILRRDKGIEMTAEIGIMLAPEFNGKGVPKEAMGKLTEFGLSTLGLSQITATFNPKNTPIIKLLRSLGYSVQLPNSKEVLHAEASVTSSQLVK